MKFDIGGINMDPRLTITLVRAEELFPCYYVRHYEIVSYILPLSDDQLNYLAENFCAGGQGLYSRFLRDEKTDQCNKKYIYEVKSTCDSSG
jgi:hypothetical protein